MVTSLFVDGLIVEDLGQQKLQARYIAGALRDANLSARVIDLNDGIEAIVAHVRAAFPRLIVSSLLFADRVDEHLALMTALRAADIRAHLTIAGHLPMFTYAELLRACLALDSVLCGEAETIAPQLARCIIHADDWRTIPGVASRFLESRVHALPHRAMSLDDLPLPLRAESSDFFATIEASRGCYHACSFCLPTASYRARGMVYRQRRVANVMDEIESLYRRGVRLFLFDDEQFLSPGSARANRVAEFADELARRNLQIAFTIKCRADDVERGLFRRLQDLGLLRVYLGVESGDQATLDLFDKRTTVRQNIEAITTLDELGIVADFRILLFHPWCTLETMDAELDFLQTVLPNLPTAFDVREVEIYPGTPLASRLRVGQGNPPAIGAMKYVIGDPRAEFVRRVHHLVFDSRGIYGRARHKITEDWYALLLARRFHEDSITTKAGTLRSNVAQINTAFLQVWRELQMFARDDDIYDAVSVNGRVAEWASTINSICAREFSAPSSLRQAVTKQSN